MVLVLLEEITDQGEASDSGKRYYVEKQLQESLKSTPVDKVDVPEVRKRIREQVKAELQLVPPGYSSRPWQIDLGFAKNYLRDKPLQLRVKFNAAQKSSAP